MKWEKLSRSTSVAKGAIHTFLGTIQDHTASDRAILSDEENAHAARFTRPDIARAFLASRIFLRRALGWSTGMNPGDLRISIDSMGKPFLENPHEKMYFNLSHSSSLLIVATSPLGPIGIDIEVRSCAPPFEANKLIFNEVERRILDQMPDRCAAFYAGWTRKEAALKCIGLGLSCDMKLIEVNVNPSRYRSIARLSGAIERAKSKSIIFILQPPEISGATAAVATVYPINTIRFWKC